MLAKLGSRAEASRELAYRLFQIAERKGWARDALGYNALVQSWPEVVRIAREGAKQADGPVQEGLGMNGAPQTSE